MFNRRIFEETAHRPWPMPDGPWVMTQTWHDLLFAHWPVDAASIRARIPSAFDLDLFEGRAWLAVVPFHMTNVTPRGMPPMPWLSAFPELNVRTYVTVDGKPGVYFFSLDASNAVAVAVARGLAKLPYYRARMEWSDAGDGWIEYRGRRDAGGAPAAEFAARYRPTAPPRPPAAGTLEYFLTERYCLYTMDRSANRYRLEIHHPPWPLQPAEARITANTMADAAGIRLPPSAPLLHFSKRQDAVAWRLERLP